VFPRRRWETVTALVVQPDGKVLSVGYANLGNNTSAPDTAKIRIRPFGFRLGQLLIFP